jgi:hypothetical protein
VRRDAIFEEDRAFRKSRGIERGENYSLQIQLCLQQTTMTQISGPSISVMTSSQVTGPQGSGS